MTENDISTRDGSDSIRIFGLEDDADRSLWRRPDEVRYGRGEVSSEELRRRVEHFISSMKVVLSELPNKVGCYNLDQIAVSAEVSAKGHVSLLGSGGEVGGKGGLIFLFKSLGAEEPNAT